MMDLTLDSKQARALSCSHCDLSKMHLRNCRNAFGKSKSPILVNGSIYFECPRAIVANNWELGYIVKLYFDCKENKTHPYGNSLLNTTAFCVEVFELMDDSVNAYREREQEKHKQDMKKLNKNPSKKGKGN